MDIDLVKRKLMDKSEQAKQKYIDAATLSSKALGDGDYKTANKQAKILRNMRKKMEALRRTYW